MHNYHDTQHSPYSPQQLFDLVIAIERYPEFLPWCRAARILERGDGRLRAELVISFKYITESYVSEVTYRRPTSPQDDGFIEVDLVQGPFERLENHWKFNPAKPKGTDISLTLAFQFRSKLLDSIIGMLFEKASAKMVSAFTQRADMLYGEKS